MKIWRIDPYFGVRGGYAFSGPGMSAESLQTSHGHRGVGRDCPRLERRP